MFVFVVIATISVCLIYFEFYFKYRDFNKIPGPSTFQFLQFRFKNSSIGITNYFQTLNVEYGSIAKIWVKPLKPFIVTNDMELFNVVYKDSKHHISPLFTEISFLKDGMSTNFDYKIWKNDISIVRKTTTKEYLSSRLKMIEAKYEKIISLINNIDEVQNVEDILKRIQLEVLIDNLIDNQNISIKDCELKSFLDNRNEFFELLREKMNSFRMTGFFHKFTKNYRRMKVIEKNIILFGSNLINKSRNVDINSRERFNIIYSMIDAGVPIRGIKIPRGTVIIFYMSNIFTSECNYKNPLQFNPERFLEDNSKSSSFIGFGYGLKECPGKQIAIIAIKLLIIKILKEFQLHPALYKPQFVSDMFLRSINGVPVKFRAKNKANLIKSNINSSN